MWNVPDKDLEALIRCFEQGGWREMRLRINGIELVLSKDASPQLREIAPTESDNNRHDAAAAIPVAPPELPRRDSSHAGENSRPPAPPSWKQIRSPSLGTFYRAPNPSSPPFVQIGDRVTEDTDICVIEVMKLFTTVTAGIKGTVREIYVGDSQLVEFDQPLILLEPHE